MGKQKQKKKYRFGLKLKFVLFITVVALITYSTSAIFLYVLYEPINNIIPMSELTFTLGILLLGIIWSGILAYGAASMITKPLERLEISARNAANGEIDNDVELSKSDDEIRSLGLAFNQMLGNLRMMVHNIETNFTETNKKVKEITESSASAAMQSEQIKRTVSEIALGAESSADAIQSTATSVEDIADIAGEAKDRAEQSEKMATHMVDQLSHSKKVIASLVNGIKELASNHETSLQAVNRLEKNAKEVEKIISLVGEISNQTNLLALNASIEAARAGEHGRGFAVVADEVRQLADESSKAVQGITELIQSIQKEVNSVVEHIQSQVETANREAGKGNETNQAIAEMTTSVEEVANAVREITTFVSKQMDSVEQTSRQSQEVAAIAEETSAGAQEVAASIEEQSLVIGNLEEVAQQLTVQAESLNDTISQFKMKGKKTS